MRLPTETTGTAAWWIRVHPRSKPALRTATPAPYTIDAQPQAGIAQARGQSPRVWPRIRRKIRGPVDSAQAPASIARLIALAISSVPTAVGSSRFGFMS